MKTKTSLSTVTKIALRTLGKMIKSARLERKLSQKDLAERLNKSRQTVMAIEKGNAEISVGTVFEAAAIVGVPLLTSDKYSLEQLSTTISNLASILPKRSKSPQKRVDDDF